jgi:hypothetical protein
MQTSSDKPSLDTLFSGILRVNLHPAELSSCPAFFDEYDRLDRQLRLELLTKWKHEDPGKLTTAILALHPWILDSILDPDATDY